MPARIVGRRRAGLSVLLLADDDRGHANTILDQLAAFRRLSAHDVRIFNPRGMARCRSLDLNEFDAVVIHYSLAITHDHYLSPDFRDKLRAFRGLKIQLIQDDYRWVDRITATMRYLGIDVLFTLVPGDQIPKIWDETRLPGVEKITYLAGYMPDDLVRLEVPPFEARPLDIAYRGRVLPYWLGRIGQEKAWIAQGTLARAGQHGLRCDVAWREEDRIYGRGWVDFLRSAKATLGSESGASITDFDGSIERAVKAYLAEHPGAGFEEVHAAVLAPFEGNVRMNVISPRIFEAAALRTGLILFPGEYSGVLTPGVHYLPLAKDFSNWEEVIDGLRDAEAMKRMIDRAYREIALSGRYSLKQFIEQFDEVVWRRGRRGKRTLKARYLAAGAERHGRLLWQQSGMQSLLRGVFRVSLASAFACASPPLLLATLRHFLMPADPERRSAREAVADLLRFGLLRAARAGWFRTGEPYAITVRLSSRDGVLSFVSRPVGSGESDRAVEARGGPDLAALQALLLAGSLRGLEWNHSLVADTASYRLSSRFATPIGFGDGGIWRFSFISVLARQQPRRLWPVLRRLAAGEPLESSWSFRAALGLRLLLRHPALAKLLLCWRVLTLARPSVRAALTTERVYADLARLAVLRERLASGGEASRPFDVTALVDPGAGRLTVVSRPLAQAASAERAAREAQRSGGAVVPPKPGNGRWREIEWVHGAVAPSVSLEWRQGVWVTLGLGQAGTWRFESLAGLSQPFPGLVWQSLLPILAAGGGAAGPERSPGPDPVEAGTAADAGSLDRQERGHRIGTR